MSNTQDDLEKLLLDYYKADILARESPMYEGLKLLEKLRQDIADTYINKAGVRTAIDKTSKAGLATIRRNVCFELEQALGLSEKETE